MRVPVAKLLSMVPAFFEQLTGGSITRTKLPESMHVAMTLRRRGVLLTGGSRCFSFAPPDGVRFNRSGQRLRRRDSGHARLNRMGFAAVMTHQDGEPVAALSVLFSIGCPAAAGQNCPLIYIYVGKLTFSGHLVSRLWIVSPLRCPEASGTR